MAMHFTDSWNHTSEPWPTIGEFLEGHLAFLWFQSMIASSYM